MPTPSSSALLDALPRASCRCCPGAVEAVRRARGALAARARVVLERAEMIDARARAIGARRRASARPSPSEEVARGKPAPDVYLEAARRLGVDAGAVRRGRGLEQRAARRAPPRAWRVVAVPMRAFPPAPDALALAAVTVGRHRGRDAGGGGARVRGGTRRVGGRESATARSRPRRSSRCSSIPDVRAAVALARGRRSASSSACGSARTTARSCSFGDGARDRRRRAPRAPPAARRARRRTR